MHFASHQMEEPLRQLLRSLCHNSEWKYAVFWKLKHRSRMLLTWEDGYCDYPKPRDTIQNLTHNVCFNDTTGKDAFDYEIKVHSGSPAGYSIGLAVANMSYLVYSLGEGIVGRVAFSRKHCWVFAEEFSPVEHDSISVSEHPDEWLVQFAAGIKTIALIPVLPLGVVQLGSLETVMEDLKLVAHVRDIFNTLQNAPGLCLPLYSSGSFSESLLPFTSLLSDDPAKLSSIREGPPIQAQSKAITQKDSDSGVHVSPQDLLWLMFQDDIQVPQTDSGFPIPEELFGNGVYEPTNHEILSEALSFPSDSELHKALVPAYREGHASCLSREEGFCTTGMINPTDFTGIIETHGMESGSWLMEGSNSEHLLDAVVGNVLHVASDDNKSCRSTIIRSPSSSLDQFAASCETHNNFGGGVDDSDLWSYVKSAFGSRSGEVATRSLSGSPSNVASSLTDDGSFRKDQGSEQTKAGVALSQASKRKTRPGEIQRPRPRDRQQIQDRVKELREIVPNGAKCSIDALLERTIKHMMFLRGITSQADKLRNCMQLKMVDNEDQDMFGTWSHHNGSSWVLDLGSETGLCPLVVKNLSHPGHILIEMLCEEHGLFLEIAQVIRRLGLTILKGVMESRSDKIWAHFIVEAIRGFQKMDIICPLLQLLEPSSKSNPNKQG